jgi:hypothetical protein
VVGGRWRRGGSRYGEAVVEMLEIEIEMGMGKGKRKGRVGWEERWKGKRVMR